MSDVKPYRSKELQFEKIPHINQHHPLRANYAGRDSQLGRNHGHGLSPIGFPHPVIEGCLFVMQNQGFAQALSVTPQVATCCKLLCDEMHCYGRWRKAQQYLKK